MLSYLEVHIAVKGDGRLGQYCSCKVRSNFKMRSSCTAEKYCIVFEKWEVVVSWLVVEYM